MGRLFCSRRNRKSSARWSSSILLHSHHFRCRRRQRCSTSVCCRRGSRSSRVVHFVPREEAIKFEPGIRELGEPWRELLIRWTGLAESAKAELTLYVVLGL